MPRSAPAPPALLRMLLMLRWRWLLRLRRLPLLPRRRLLLRWLLLPFASPLRLVRHQRFEADELVAVLLQNRARERAPPHHEHRLAVLLQFVQQRDEVAVPAHDRERVDVTVRERHLQRIQRQVDVRAVLVSTRRRHALHHLHRVLRHLPFCPFLPAPVRVGELGHDVSPLAEAFQHRGHFKLPLQCRFHADFNVVVVDEHGDFQFVCHFDLFSDPPLQPACLVDGRMNSTIPSSEAPGRIAAG